MKRNIVLSIVVTLLIALTLMTPTPPKHQSGAVASVLHEVVPTGECQSGDCATIRQVCYRWANNMRTFCFAVTEDSQRCNDDWNTSYRSCAGACW